MKKQYKTIFIVGLVLVVLIVSNLAITSLLSPLGWKNSARYSTPEEALTYDKTIKSAKILYVVEDNDVAIISLLKDDNIERRYIFKKEDGWMGASAKEPGAKKLETIILNDRRDTAILNYTLQEKNILLLFFARSVVD